ncbi:CDP-glycerol glycerophosphotransferase family protein [Halobacillus trueperi]|uniref:CDP-glycerol glycerophosphotransferase family protein n=1 Tax=Halobacillus trueperi TaxID=156205 RepID=UPI003736633B
MKKILSLIIIHILNCLPIKKNKVFMFSYYGSQYGCNPKYLTKYMLDHKPDQFDIVWAFNDPRARQVDDRVRKVKIMSLRYFYELCTSKVIITNFRSTDLFVKRKKQTYIQTWHSSLRLKQIEKDAEHSLPAHYIDMAKKDSKKCDLLLSGSAYSTQIFRRSFWYEGEILEKGTPRNDFLCQSDVTNKIKNKLNIESNKKIVLYAPTFRKNNDMSVYDLDYAKLKESLTKRFGDEWIVLVKLHPHLISLSDRIQDKNIVDVTKYDDIQELLHISDVLITDYSSLMFDFSITKRPCFLYVPDLDTYQNQDRKLYFDVNKLPFLPALTNEQLEEKIRSFSEGDYQRNLDLFLHHIGTFENGRASEEVVNYITDACFNKKRSELDEAI